MLFRNTKMEFAKKMLRLLEVQIFFAMSVFGGNAVLKHTATASSAAKERTKPAAERAIWRAKTLATALLFSETCTQPSTIEQGVLKERRCERSALVPLLSAIDYFAAQHGQDWLCWRPTPQAVPYNLLQELAPLRI